LILHRYVAINRRDAIEPAIDALLAVVDDVYPIDLADTHLARRLVTTSRALSARDALHVAVMQRHDVGIVMSFDRGFDGIPGIERLAS
jgi:predicted nucleic acid-binding protein